MHPDFEYGSVKTACDAMCVLRRRLECIGGGNIGITGDICMLSHNLVYTTGGGIFAKIIYHTDRRTMKRRALSPYETILKILDSRGPQKNLSSIFKQKDCLKDTTYQVILVDLSVSQHHGNSLKATCVFQYESSRNDTHRIHNPQPFSSHSRRFSYVFREFVF